MSTKPASNICFFNTLTRRKEVFTPIEPGKVGLYTCGPTVYGYAHIGNFRAFIFEDLLAFVITDLLKIHFFRWMRHGEIHHDEMQHTPLT